MGEKLVDVFSASGEMEAHVIKGLLESNGIPCILKMLLLLMVWVR